MTSIQVERGHVDRQRLMSRSVPDETVVVWRDGEVVGRCSCWWRSTPKHEGSATGFIGHYAAIDADAGASVLSRACGVLARAGCALALGPIDGSTWQSYRFIVERGPEPAFFLEPEAPDDWPMQWRAHGFSRLATYTSAIVDRLDVEPAVVARAASRLASAGISIRALDASRVDEELRRIFALSEVSFQHNFLYSPIGFEDFRQQYHALVPVVRPELVLLAERSGDLVGFALALPDVLEVRRTGSARTVVVKTVAVHPSAAGAGLGGVLVACIHRRAHEGGFERAIHALMHDSNSSRSVSSRFARPFRRYALFVKALEERFQPVISPRTSDSE